MSLVTDERDIVQLNIASLPQYCETLSHSKHLNWIVPWP